MPRDSGTILSRTPVDPSLVITEQSEIVLDPNSGTYLISVGPEMFEVAPDGSRTGRSMFSPRGQDVKGMEFGDDGKFFLLEGDGTLSLLRLQESLPCDLTGTWLNCEVIGKTSGTNTTYFLQGSFRVENAGSAPTPASTVQFCLSGDNRFDVNDKLLGKPIAIPALQPSEMKVIQLNSKLRTAVAASGKFVIANLDPAGSIAEIEEGNNHVAFGPVP